MNTKVNESILHTADNIRDIQYRIHCASELVRVLHTALEYGPNQIDKNELDALFGASWLLYLLDSEFESEVTELETAAMQLIRQNMEGLK